MSRWRPGVSFGASVQLTAELEARVRVAVRVHENPAANSGGRKGLIIPGGRLRLSGSWAGMTFEHCGATVHPVIMAEPRVGLVVTKRPSDPKQEVLELAVDVILDVMGSGAFDFSTEILLVGRFRASLLKATRGLQSFLTTLPPPCPHSDNEKREDAIKGRKMALMDCIRDVFNRQPGSPDTHSLHSAAYAIVDEVEVQSSLKLPPIEREKRIADLVEMMQFANDWTVVGRSALAFGESLSGMAQAAVKVVDVPMSKEEILEIEMLANDNVGGW